MATAMVSALSGRAARHDVAMTGEITLSGRVLPIGGLKEKVLGAVRAGIKHIVIPKANEPDLDDLPRDVLASLIVTPVETLGHVLPVHLLYRRASVPRTARVTVGDDRAVALF
jgi:ATP-dependent Lon protease